MKTILNKWKLDEYATENDGEYIAMAWGDVHGHKEQSAMSSYIHTSYILEIRVNSDHLEVQTSNTLYQLYYEEVSPELFENKGGFERTKDVVGHFCGADSAEKFAGYINAVRGNMTTFTRAGDDEFDNVVDILMKRYEAAR